MESFQSILRPYEKYIFTFMLLCFLLEFTANFLQKKRVYSWRETLATIGVSVGIGVVQTFLTSYKAAILIFGESLALWKFEQTLSYFIFAFLLTDLLYYIQHYLLHKVSFLWCFHIVHHSSPEFNLFTGFRNNWFAPLITPFFYLPGTLLGFSVTQILMGHFIVLFIQFVAHTQFVPKLGFLEGIIATPSAHRVHHGNHLGLMEKNFGGGLMIWDRLFKTYIPEPKKFRYGIPEGFISYNPIILVLHKFIQFFKAPTQFQKHSRGSDGLS